MTQDTVVVTPFLRNLVSHATGGALDLEEHPDATLNSICVAISQHRNRIWKDAEQRGFKLCQDAAVKVAESAFAPGTGVSSEQMRAGRKIADAIRALSIKETDNAR